MRRVVAILIVGACMGGWAPVLDASAATISHCEAGARFFDSGDLAAAKGQYEKALEGDPTRACGVEGLQKVAKRSKSDERLTASDVASEVWNVILNSAWPWLAALALLRVFGPIVRGHIFKTGRITVTAPKDQKDFATLIVEAAAASGREGRRPLKVMTAEDAAPAQDPVADLSKLLGLPAALPIQPLLNLAGVASWTNRLQVYRACAGGWWTVDVIYRRPAHRRMRTRVALQLGSGTTAEQEAVLALVIGAWLVSIDDQLLTNSKPKVRLAFALFRAGANLQARGDDDSALACIRAMPPILIGAEARAWAGARMNMVALLGLARLAEAGELARTTVDRLGALTQDRTVDQKLIRDLLLRAKYIGASLWIDAEASQWKLRPQPTKLAPMSPEPVDACVEAADWAEKLGTALDDDLERKEKKLARERPGERQAMGLTMLAHRIMVAEPPDAPELLKDLVELLDVRGAAVGSPSPPLSATTHYDAASAYALLAALVASDPGAVGEGADDPGAVPSAGELIERALIHLKTSLAATSTAQRARVREQAETDPTLFFARDDAAPSGPKRTQFNIAVGAPKSPDPSRYDLTVHLAPAG